MKKFYGKNKIWFFDFFSFWHKIFSFTFRSEISYIWLDRENISLSILWNKNEKNQQRMGYNLIFENGPLWFFSYSKINVYWCHCSHKYKFEYWFFHFKILFYSEFHSEYAWAIRFTNRWLYKMFSLKHFSVTVSLSFDLAFSPKIGNQMPKQTSASFALCKITRRTIISTHKLYI